MALTHTEAPCQSLYPFAIHRTIGDQPQGARHQIGAHIPVGRARTGYRMATPTATKTRRLRGRCAGIEAHLGGMGGTSRADRPAIDTCRHNADEEASIEACVTATESPVAQIKILR